MSKIRECFTSRFDGGVLMEVDFSQLEVAALAFLSQDRQLIHDIDQDLDMHLVSASWVTGREYEELLAEFKAGNKTVIKIRKEAKRPRFELQYGAGPATIAKNNGWPLSKANEYISRYYERYPEVGEWQRKVAEEVQYNARPRKKWGNELVSHYECPHTHRRYVFYSKENKAGQQYFSPTQMKNYPVQGFATGDLVPTVLGNVIQYIYSNNLQDDILLINTVHDSVLFDININTDFKTGSITSLITNTFGRTKEIMKEIFNIDINVPIRYSVETGTTWGNMKEVKI